MYDHLKRVGKDGGKEEEREGEERASICHHD